MGVIIPIPTFVDPQNPTADEQAADTLYKAQMQVGRDELSPDITVRFTPEQIPDAVLSEQGLLLISEAKVMKDSGYDTAAIQALAADSPILTSLVYATILLLVIARIPQAAQMIREGLLGDSRQFKEIDEQAREAKLRKRYQDAILTVNADAVFESTGDLGTPVILTTKSRLY